MQHKQIHLQHTTENMSRNKLMMRILGGSANMSLILLDGVTHAIKFPQLKVDIQGTRYNY